MRTLTSLAATTALVATPLAASAQVLDLGGGGSFSNPFAATNTGRAVSWFWDNTSADATGANVQCNVGYYALGTMDSGCRNQAAGTLANQGGFAGGDAWGSGLAPAPFMFSGSYIYNLRLTGSLAGGTSEIGIFTRESDGLGGWVYSFTAINSFGAKLVNSTYQVGGGADWGFYIRNAFNPAGGGCGGVNTDCSDASGGFSGEQFQQFALFRGASTWSYLVGAEDNALGLRPSPFDSDYNDYMVEVTVTPEPLTMALLATGLVGLAGASFVQRRRRRQLD